jgi:YfiH family protein
MITDFIRDRFGIEASLTTCNQVHGARVQRARHERTWRECDSCDALWSADAGVALAIKVADCLPVSIVSDRAVANIHSGWRGTVQMITAATIDSMALGGDVGSARAYLGPTIRACCFEVGEEVVGQFAGAFDGFERYVDRSRPKPHLDLVALTADVLRIRGFSDRNIIDSGLCTRCEGSIFHSYRRDRSGGGRNLAIVAR